MSKLDQIQMGRRSRPYGRRFTECVFHHNHKLLCLVGDLILLFEKLTLGGSYWISSLLFAITKMSSGMDFLLEMTSFCKLMQHILT